MSLCWQPIQPQRQTNQSLFPYETVTSSPAAIGRTVTATTVRRSPVCTSWNLAAGLQEWFISRKTPPSSKASIPTCLFVVVFVLSAFDSRR
jgi:hypothetical protein